MTDEEKTKEQLLEELKALRMQVAALGESQKRRRHDQGALDEPMNFFQILVDTIPNPIFFKSVDGLYLGCNKAFEAFLGLERDKVVGKPVYEIAFSGIFVLGKQLEFFSLNEEVDTIADTVEPYLLKAGYLRRTSRGRTATKLAFEHFGIKYEKQEELF